MEDKKPDPILEVTDDQIDEMDEEQLREFAKSGIKTIKKNYDNGVQKVIQEKKGLETIVSATKEVLTDKSKMVELYASNPEMAEQILREAFGGISIDEYKEKHLSAGVDADQKVEDKFIERKLQSVLEQLPESIRDEFLKEYNDLVGGRKLTEAEAIVKMDKALKLISVDTKVDDVVPLGTQGGGQKRVDSKAKDFESRKTYAQDLMKQHG